MSLLAWVGVWVAGAALMGIFLAICNTDEEPGAFEIIGAIVWPVMLLLLVVAWFVMVGHNVRRRISKTKEGK